MSVPGGPHVVELRARGHEADRQEVQVAARAEQELTLELEERFDGISPVFFWSTLGGAVVSAGIGAVFGVQALSARADIDDRLADPEQAHGVVESELDDVADLAGTADVLFVVAGGLSVGAAVLLFVTDFGGGGDGGSALITPELGPDRAGILFADAGRADHVEVDVAMVGGQVRVAFAFQVGCGADARVHLGRARLRSGSLVELGLSEMPATGEGGATPSVRRRPAVLAAGHPRAEPDEGVGGWMVAWAEAGTGGRILGRRADDSGEWVDDPFVLGDADMGRPAFDAPILFDTVDGAGAVGFRDRAGRRFVVRPACGAPD